MYQYGRHMVNIENKWSMAIVRHFTIKETKMKP
jgi:hypothetical protein